MRLCNTLLEINEILQKIEWVVIGLYKLGKICGSMLLITGFHPGLFHARFMVERVELRHDFL